ELDGTPMTGTVAGSRLKHFYVRELSASDLHENDSEDHQADDDGMLADHHTGTTDMHVEVVVPGVDAAAPLDFVEV
ncbi:MAG: hypothetical protein Q9223_007964, partial [Gallowayella weberi]